MTIDRGGLQYGIDVTDGFSQGFDDFIAKVRLARTEWKGLRTDLGVPLKVTATGLDDQASGAREAAKARREEAAAKRDEERAKRAAQRLAEIRENAQNSIGKRAAELERRQALDQGAAQSAAIKARLEREEAALQRRLADETRIGRQIEDVLERGAQREIAAANKVAAEQARIRSATLAAETAARKARFERDADALAKRLKAEKDIADKIDAVFTNSDRRDAATAQAQSEKATQGIIAAEAAARKARFERDADALAKRLKEEAAVADKIEKILIKSDARQAKELAATQRKQSAEIDKAVAQQIRAGKQLERQQDAQAKAAEKAAAAEQKALDRSNARNAKQLQDALKGSDDAASRLFFTFRRLFGILAVFQAARVLVGKFKDAITEVFRFNSQIENAVLGVQALLTAVGSISTAQGRTLEGAEKFAAANAEARRQVQLLRVEGLKTAATFDQLLVAFQNALAPGIRAGLNPDQIRQFAVRIAQAAASIGLPQEQLAEEIRSILQGTIQSRTTRIAVALGISNEDIRRAKEAGKLADFLLARFDAFKFSGEDALRNFTVLVSNVKDAVSQVIGTGGRDLFDFVVTGLRRVLNQLVKTTPDGVILNPKAVELARQFFAVILQTVTVARDIFAFLTLDAAVEAATKFASLLRTVVVLGGGFVKGFVDGMRLAAALAETVGSALGSALKAFGFRDALPIEDFKTILGVLGLILAASVALRTVFSTLKLPIQLLLGTLRPVSTILTKIIAGTFEFLGLTRTAAVSANLLSAPFLIVAALIGVIVAAFTNDFIRSIDIGGLKIGTIADILKTEVLFQVKKVGVGFELVWDLVAAGAKIAFENVVSFFKKTLTQAQLAVAKSKKFFGIEGAADEIKRLEDELKGIDDKKKAAVDAIEAEAKAKIIALSDELAAARAEAEARKKLLKDLDKQGPRRTIAEAFDEIVSGLQKKLSAEQKVSKEEETQQVLVANLIDQFSKLPPILDAVVDALKNQGEILRDLKEKTADLNDEVRASQVAAGVEGIAATITNAFAATTTEIRHTTKELSLQGKIAGESLAGIEERHRALTEEITRSGRISVLSLDNIVNAGLRLNDIESRRATNEKALNALLEEQKLAVEAGDKAREEAANNSIKSVREEASNLFFLVENQKDAVRTLLRLAGLDDEQTKALTGRIIELAKLEGSRISIKKTIAEISKAVGEIESGILEKQSKQIQKLAIEEEARLKIINKRIAAELEGAKFVAEAKAQTQGIAGPLPGTQNETIRALAQSRADLTLAHQKSEEIRNQFALQKQILESAIKNERNEDTRIALQRALNQASKEFNTNLEKANVDVKQIIDEMQRLKFILDNPIQAGFSAALEDFAARARDSFAAWQEIGRTAVEGFADYASDTISRALDPTQKLDLVARFRSLMQSIVDEIIKAFVRLEIVKLILEPLGLVGNTSEANIAAASAAAATAIGAATSAAASAALAQAALAQVVAVQATAAASSSRPSFLGFAAGGSIPDVATGVPRPAGLPSSDTVPIWATPNEFMQPVAAVMKYGRDVMEAIRQRRIDPVSLRSLAGVRGAAQGRRRSAGIGYALGGEIQRLRGSASGRSSDFAPVLKIVNVFDRSEILGEVASRNGQRVMINVIRANNDKLRGAR